MGALTIQYIFFKKFFFAIYRLHGIAYGQLQKVEKELAWSAWLSVLEFYWKRSKKLETQADENQEKIDLLETKEVDNQKKMDLLERKPDQLNQAMIDRLACGGQQHVR